MDGYGGDLIGKSKMPPLEAVIRFWGRTEQEKKVQCSAIFPGTSKNSIYLVYEVRCRSKPKEMEKKEAKAEELETCRHLFF
jgi:hypothetical protein